MRVITAPEEYTPQREDVHVFLAGGIMDCPDWQSEVIERLSRKRATDHLVVLNPRRADFPMHDPDAATEQINWEFNWLEKCDIFSMYFSEGESVQPICMYELGRNILRTQIRFPEDWHKRIIVSAEHGYKRIKDVQIQTGLACEYSVLDCYRCYDESHEDTVEAHVKMIYQAYLLQMLDRKLFNICSY